ncbi:MAG: zinc-binding alcohol dehydrogenase family protein [Myxococcales bacterium]|nr:zinc-binding alcohol dehydrogenase family protein [Myxococcales bacterium]
MAETTTAWILKAAAGAKPGPGQLEQAEITLPDIALDQCLVEPLFGCWEGNMSHAVERDPVDICKQRGEPHVVLGNAGTVRVLAVGERVTTVKVGDLAMLFCNGVWDKWGYPIKIFGYDAPGTIGLLARRTVTHEKQLIPLPENTRFSLPQWAAFSLRYVTAWSNWHQAHNTWRVQMTIEDCPSPYVWGWGGGVTWAELTLAKFWGSRVAMISGNPKRLYAIESAGMKPIDRRLFKHLEYDMERYKADPEYKKRYLESEETFLRIVREHTQDIGVSIFLDYVGSPVIRATLKALSRQGVIATAGWKEGMKSDSVRAIECISRHTHVHTHYARYGQGRAAVQFAENTGWMPEDTPKYDIFPYDSIPQLQKEYDAGHQHSYFPIFQVNKL